jgi:hypothetical protein
LRYIEAVALQEAEERALQGGHLVQTGQTQELIESGHIVVNTDGTGMPGASGMTSVSPSQQDGYGREM